MADESVQQPERRVDSCQSYQGNPLVDADKLKQEINRLCIKAGERGLSMREMINASRIVRVASQSALDVALASLMLDDLVDMVKIKNRRGPCRVAYVPVSEKERGKRQRLDALMREVLP